MKNIIIVYNPFDGAVVQDAKVRQFCETLDDNKMCVIGSELIITQLRVMHKNRELNIAGFYYNTGETLIPISIDSDGRISYWPDGFCDYNDKLLENLILT